MSAICRCPARTARYRAGSIARTVSSARHCWFMLMAAVHAGQHSELDHFLRDLVRESGSAVLSVDYKLSPEVKFRSRSTRCGDDPARAREGSGFGSTRAALPSAATLRRQSGARRSTGVARGSERTLRFMLLIYGCFSTDTESASWQRFGKGGLSQTQMRWIWETYAEKLEQLNDWRLAPMVADLAGLPPAHLIVGSLDPLLDDSNNLAAS